MKAGDLAAETRRNVILLSQSTPPVYILLHSEKGSQKIEDCSGENTTVTFTDIWVMLTDIRM